MTLRFGTDGVRGEANTELTPELLVALGRAAARVLQGGTFLIGRDTRVSGPMVQAALTAGLHAEGADVADLGVLPTPAVAHLSAELGLPAAVISASHNPYPDNGVKLFAAGGRKLADDVEQSLEAELDELTSGAGDTARLAGAALGRTATLANPSELYADHLTRAMEGRGLGGLRVALDCANGAASAVAPAVCRALGAEVSVIHDRPDGTNINDRSGSTHPGDLQQLVVSERADLGLAFDGDADRVLAVDHTGALVDGDQIMAICAVDMHERHVLAEDTVVITVMSNLGFRMAMEDRGIRVAQTQVGDRYVLEALEAGGWSLGGEQSGHVIFRRLATTGDGLLTGLMLMDVMQRSGRLLADLAGIMHRLPQVLRNVRVAQRDGLDSAQRLWDEVRAVERELGASGRVLLRPSGTEPLVRVMVEAPTEAEANSAAEKLCIAVERELGSA
jgi:phosphoglucosamine mutase